MAWIHGLDAKGKTRDRAQMRDLCRTEVTSSNQRPPNGAFALAGNNWSRCHNHQPFRELENASACVSQRLMLSQAIALNQMRSDALWNRHFFATLQIKSRA